MYCGHGGREVKLVVVDTEPLCANHVLSKNIQTARSAESEHLAVNQTPNSSRAHRHNNRFSTFSTMSFRARGGSRGGFRGSDRGGSFRGGRGGGKRLIQRLRKNICDKMADGMRRSRWWLSVQLWPSRSGPRYVRYYLLDCACLTAPEIGTFMHPSEGDIVCESTNPKVPFFNAPIYLENKVSQRDHPIETILTIYRQQSARLTRFLDQLTRSTSQ